MKVPATEDVGYLLVLTQFDQWTGTQRHQLVYAIDPPRSRNISNYGDNARKRGASLASAVAQDRETNWTVCVASWQPALPPIFRVTCFTSQLGRSHFCATANESRTSA